MNVYGTVYYYHALRRFQFRGSVSDFWIKRMLNFTDKFEAGITLMVVSFLVDKKYKYRSESDLRSCEVTY